MQPVARTQLVEARKRRQWSQQAVADRLGTTQHNVSRWERGQTRPGAYFRAKLCALFGMSAQELGLLGHAKGEAPAPPLSSAAPSTSPPPHVPGLAPGGPTPLCLMPHPRNPFFTGRDDLLEQVEQLLPPSAPGESTNTHCTALTQRLAITGVAGIGKTQIAVEYAYRAREQGRYRHTLWINATSEEAILTSLVLLAEELPACAVPSQPDQRQLVGAITSWLEHCPDPWLLIVDNADDLALVQQYLPQQGRGCILFTTRAHAVGALAQPLAVETMGLVEGTQLLLRRAKRLPASDQEFNAAMNVVMAFDGFPLALDQAGAYMEETGCRCEDYLHLYQEHRQTLLARRGQPATPYPASVATAWVLAFQTLQARNPAAAELLCLCAFLSPDHIPEELIQAGAAEWPSSLQAAAANRLAFNQVLEDLLRCSLVKRLGEERLLSIHRLVQAVQQDQLEADQQRQWTERAVRALQQLFPRDPQEVGTQPACLRYLEHVQTCARLVKQYHVQVPEAADLLDRTATYLRKQATHSPAKALYQQALALREQMLGGKHPDVVTSLNNLAILSWEQGLYAEALPLVQRALVIQEQTLGRAHPDVASSLNTLAELYWEQGAAAQAVPLAQRALSIREHALGPDHPRVGASLNMLARLYQDQRQGKEALAVAQRALLVLEQALGPEHPDVVETRARQTDLLRALGQEAGSKVTPVR